MNKKEQEIRASGGCVKALKGYSGYYCNLHPNYSTQIITS